MTITKEQLAAGTKLQFVKYAEGEPAEGVVLKAGDQVEVVSFEESADGVLDITVSIPNPDFKKKKKISANNPKDIHLNVWDDEVVLVEEEKPAGRRKAAAKTPAKTPAKAAAKSKAKAPAKQEEKAPAKAKDKAKDKPAKAPEAYVPEWDKLKSEDEEIVAIVEEAGESLTEVIKEAVEARGNEDYRLGGLLYHLALTGGFTEEGEEYAGAKGFTKYCDDVLEIGYRKARYLVNIYYQFNKLGISGEEVAKIGWTKARAIAETATMAEKDDEIKFNKTEAKKLVKLAAKEDTTVKSLNDHITESYRSPSSVPKEKFTNIKISVPQTRGSQLLDIIETAKEQFEVEDTSDAVAKIIEEWGMEMAGEA